MIQPTHQPVALVTGANRGIGLETAGQLAQQGFVVFLSARLLEDAQAAADRLTSEGVLGIIPAQLDVTRAADRTAMAERIDKEYGRLDVLVNNAGVGAPDGDLTQPIVSATSEQELREVFDVNLFGVVLLTQALLPLLKEASSARIVNVSSQLGSLELHASGAARVAYNKRFAYNASKAALNMFTILLAHELRGTTIKVNSVHPGWVKTRLGGTAAPLETSAGASMSLQAALLGADGPTGSFLESAGTLPW